jgi:hypothetical protein
MVLDPDPLFGNHSDQMYIIQSSGHLLQNQPKVIYNNYYMLKIN